MNSLIEKIVLLSFLLAFVKAYFTCSTQTSKFLENDLFSSDITTLSNDIPLIVAKQESSSKFYTLKGEGWEVEVDIGEDFIEDLLADSYYLDYFICGTCNEEKSLFLVVINNDTTLVHQQIYQNSQITLKSIEATEEYIYIFGSQTDEPTSTEIPKVFQIKHSDSSYSLTEITIGENILLNSIESGIITDAEEFGIVGINTDNYPILILSSMTGVVTSEYPKIYNESQNGNSYLLEQFSDDSIIIVGLNFQEQPIFYYLTSTGDQLVSYVETTCPDSDLKSGETCHGSYNKIDIIYTTQHQIMVFENTNMRSYLRKYEITTTQIQLIDTEFIDIQYSDYHLNEIIEISQIQFYASGSAYSSTYGALNLNCYICANGCSSCSGPLNDQCLTCEEGLYLKLDDSTDSEGSCIEREKCPNMIVEEISTCYESESCEISEYKLVDSGNKLRPFVCIDESECSESSSKVVEDKVCILEGSCPASMVKIIGFSGSIECIEETECTGSRTLDLINEMCYEDGSCPSPLIKLVTSSDDHSSASCIEAEDCSESLLLDELNGYCYKEGNCPEDLYKFVGSASASSSENSFCGEEEDCGFPRSKNKVDKICYNDGSCEDYYLFNNPYDLQLVECIEESVCVAPYTKQTLIKYCYIEDNTSEQTTQQDTQEDDTQQHQTQEDTQQDQTQEEQTQEDDTQVDQNEDTSQQSSQDETTSEDIEDPQNPQIQQGNDNIFPNDSIDDTSEIIDTQEIDSDENEDDSELSAGSIIAIVVSSIFSVGFLITILILKKNVIFAKCLKSKVVPQKIGIPVNTCDTPTSGQSTTRDMNPKN